MAERQEIATVPKPLARLNRLYEARRVLLPPMGERPVRSMIAAAFLAMALMSILLSLAWVQKSDIDYLRGSSGVAILEDIEWTLSVPGAAPATVPLATLGDMSVKELAGAAVKIRATIPTATMRDFMSSTDGATVVLSLPAIEFQKLEVVSTWLPRRTLARGEPALFVFDRTATDAAERFELQLTVWPSNTQERIIRSTVNMVPTFLAVQSRFQKYEDFLAGRRTGSGKQLADIGRIVLAVFSVFLFLFIDSSPECLALGIFMGLKALAVAAGQGWLPDGWFTAETMNLSRNFLLSFADFMQLYFFTQLARIWRPRPFWWLAAGLVFGSFYSWGTTIVPTPGGINWPFYIWKWRNVLIGLACLTCALPVAFICWRARLYHRAAALLVASSGVLVQVITPMIVDIPGVTESNWYKTWYNLFETHTPYMFALSTFINVSTLERRVKTLSRAAIRKDAIERELTLGKAVQDAFFHIPEMPEGVRLSYSHNAAEYVSGDTLFSHWDKQTDTVSMVLCDVTGHGVQAALKASICSAICASIWEHGQMRPGDDPAHRLGILHRRVTAYLTKTSGNAEVLAMAGCEIDLRDGDIRLYRANGVYPLIVVKVGDRWVPTVEALPSEKLQHSRIGGPCFVVLFSDGIIDGPRTMRRLVQHVDAELNRLPELSAQIVKESVLSFGGFVETNDDKTLAVLEIDAQAARRSQVIAA